MTDYLPFPPPNALGEAFSESGIGGGGGGGAVSTYTLSATLNEIILTPNGGGASSSVDVGTLPDVAAAYAKTARITSADNINTYMTGGISFSAVSPSIRPELTGILNVETENLILNSNIITTAGTGASAVVKINGSNVLATPATWADYPAGNVVSVPQGTGMNIYDDLNFGTGNIAGYYPDATFYPTNFQVGGGTLLVPNPLTAARNISLYSGIGGTSIASIQGVGIFGGADVDITAGGIIAITATTDINLLASLITMEGIVNITGENNTIGNTSVEGGFEVVGLTTLNGETTITGQTNITGLTTITGGIEVSAVANLNGGLAVEGAVGIVGQTSLTGNLNQIGGTITTTGSITTPDITSVGDINISAVGNIALVNLSSINGVEYVPGTNTPWYSVPAQTNVNMGSNILSNVCGLEAPALGTGASSNISLLSPSGNINISAPQGVNISGSAGINLNSDIGVSVNGLLNANRIAILGSTIVGVSTINGLPYEGSASSWANFPAIANVNLATSTINNASIINVAPGQNFTLANSLTATNIQGGSQLNLTGVANGANVAITAGTGGSVRVQSPMSVSSIVGVSSINGAVYPPPGDTPWYNVPAGGSVNMVNYNLSNIGNLFSPVGDLSFLVGGGNQTSYVRFNDSGAGYFGSGSSNPNITFTTTNTDPSVANQDNVYFNTNAVRVKGGLELLNGNMVVAGAGAEIIAPKISGGNNYFDNDGLTLSESGTYIQFPDTSRQYTAYPYPYIPGTPWAIGQVWVFNGIPLAKLPIPVSTDPPPPNQNIGAMDYSVNPICNRSPSTSYPFSAVSGDTTTFQTNTGGLYRLTFSCDATQQLPSPVGTSGGFSLSLRNNATGTTISGQMCGQFQNYVTVGSQDQIYMIAPTCGTFTGLLLANTSYSMYLANPPYATFGIRGLALSNIKWAWEYLGIAQP